MAKSFDNLYPEICSFENLYQAWRKAAKGKRSCPAAASFEVSLSDELIQLQQELITQTWQPGEYYSFTILLPTSTAFDSAQATE